MVPTVGGSKPPPYNSISNSSLNSNLLLSAHHLILRYPLGQLAAVEDAVLIAPGIYHFQVLHTVADFRNQPNLNAVAIFQPDGGIVKCHCAAGFMNHAAAKGRVILF